jgi:aspartyl/glutamyl-tRNA(Asn/Gln) amidotransferase C subunit
MLNDKTIKNLSALCKVPEESVRELIPDLEKIIEYFGKIADYQTESDISAPISMAQLGLDIREDILSRFADARKVLDSGPNSEYGFFITPSAIEN